MSVFNHKQPYKERRSKKWLLLILLVPLFCLLAAGGYGAYWYGQNIDPVDVNDDTSQEITVNPGATEDSISTQLEQAGLIRSAAAYKLYVRIHNAEGKMQAGEYMLSPALSVSEIVDTFLEGKVAVELITILPAQRLDQIVDAFLAAGYTQTEIDEALDPTNYADHPALADKPRTASLEGYLYPESFQVTPATPLRGVVQLALDETAKMLSSKLKNDLAVNHGLTSHEAVILASIVEREVSNSEDRTKVAQVFVKRLKENVALGSDPTSLYGALLFGIEPSVSADTPYNTRLYPGLPPGPINNVSAESLQAVAYPADTDFLFFVSGDDGNTYFSNTVAEHEALAAQHCIELCRSY